MRSRQLTRYFRVPRFTTCCQATQRRTEGGKKKKGPATVRSSESEVWDERIGLKPLAGDRGPVFSSWPGFAAVPGRLRRRKQVSLYMGESGGTRGSTEASPERAVTWGPAGLGAYAVGRWGSCWPG